MTNMYLEIQAFPDPQAPGQSFTAYAKIGSLYADFQRGRGRFTLVVYRTIDAMTSGAAPVETITVVDGSQIFGNLTAGAVFPNMAQIQSDNAAAWAAIWQYLLNNVITLNSLTDATIQTQNS